MRRAEVGSKGNKACQGDAIRLGIVSGSFRYLACHSEVRHKVFIVVSSFGSIDDEVVVGGVLRLDVRVDGFCDKLCFQLRLG